MTRCLVLCGGANVRWQGHLGHRRKHLIDVDGECLLQRTLAQARLHFSGQPTVVINQGDAELYRERIPGALNLFEIAPDPVGSTEAWKFLSSRALWNEAGATVVLLGDVWFSTEAMQTIALATPAEWTAFGRAGASRLTEHPHAELFAQRFTDSGRHLEQLLRLDALYRGGACRRTAGWGHYHLMIGADPAMQCAGKDFVQIDDFTDDFDTPADYERWHAARARWRTAQATEPPVRPLAVDYSVKSRPVSLWSAAGIG